MSWGQGSHWVDDVWSRLCKADVVVSHAGQNAVAEIAAARRPAVLVAERRPHDEQIHTARALAAAGVVRLADSWEDVVAAMVGSRPDPALWELWAPPGAAEDGGPPRTGNCRRRCSVTSRVAVITTVAGRHDHLLASTRRTPKRHPRSRRARDRRYGRSGRPRTRRERGQLRRAGHRPVHPTSASPSTKPGSRRGAPSRRGCTRVPRRRLHPLGSTRRPLRRAGRHRRVIGAACSAARSAISRQVSWGTRGSQPAGAVSASRIQLDRG